MRAVKAADDDDDDDDGRKRAPAVVTRALRVVVVVVAARAISAGNNARHDVAMVIVRRSFSRYKEVRCFVHERRRRRVAKSDGATMGKLSRENKEPLGKRDDDELQSLTRKEGEGVAFLFRTATTPHHTPPNTSAPPHTTKTHSASAPCQAWPPPPREPRSSSA